VCCFPIGVRGREPLAVVPGHSHLRYGLNTAARLQRLAGAFRLVWATSWEEEANEVISPLFGLPALPVIFFNDEAQLGESWKLPAIRRHVGDRPFAYVDDDIGNDAHEWARQRDAPTLLLAIRGDRGLSADDVDDLMDFAARIARA